MSQDNSQKGRRRKPASAKPKLPRIDLDDRISTSTTVGEFAKKVFAWFVEWADEDDIQRFVAEFEGVPIENVTLVGDDIKIIAVQP